jgi:hypothetical protein
MIWFRKERRQSVLGLTLSRGQLSAAHVVNSRGRMKTVKAASVPLTLDIGRPEATGGEIKNHLREAGIQERICVVEVPPDWVMCQCTQLPGLSPEDAASFLQLEAEKGFPYDSTQLMILTSFQRSSEATYATQIAVRKDWMEQLVATAAAAGLRPVSLSLGITALEGVTATPGEGRMTVAVESKGITMLASADGGVTGFRRFNAAEDSGKGENLLSKDAVWRELRLTLEQMPAGLRGDKLQLSFCGDERMVDLLADGLADRLASQRVEVVGNGSRVRLSDRIAEAMARRWLSPNAPQLEFLPPRPERWLSLKARYGSKRLVPAVIALGSALTVAVAMFVWQGIRLRLLRSEWERMQTRVAALSEIQSEIQQYRPWVDRSFPHLRILRRVTDCFPDNGSVTAKSLDVRGSDGLTTVSISGTASDHKALLQTLDRLRKASAIQGLKIETISGKEPSQFTFSFRWIGDSGS